MPKAELHLLDPDPNRKPKHDLTGQTFHRWTVIGYAGRKRSKGNCPSFWMCRCECGNESIIFDGSLKSGASKSCGCYKTELQRERITHGMARSSEKEPEYNTWCRIIQRCTNQNNPRYCDYGGRGITVCEAWMSFENFYDDMGKRPSELHSIGRIDNDGPYAPTNCRWELSEQQVTNKRNNFLVEYNGETLCLSEASAKFGIDRETLKARIKRGMTAKEAIETPVRLTRTSACKGTHAPPPDPTPQA